MCQTWLGDLLGGCVLSNDAEDYLLGRGVKESTILSEGMVSWVHPKEPVSDLKFVKTYGKYGEKLDGLVICPVWSPKGNVIGFEGRSIQQKYITDFRLSDASWNPFWIGLNKALPKIWAGGDVWVGEGLFDIAALNWVIPESDAVLASVRAKLTRNHVMFLKRFCRGWVHMVYDRDVAGRNGVLGYVDSKTGKRQWGALDVLKFEGLKCVDTLYHGGSDPGEIWDKGGVSAVKAAFKI